MEMKRDTYIICAAVLQAEHTLFTSDTYLKWHHV